MSYEKQGTAHDPHAAGYELQGRDKAPSPSMEMAFADWWNADGRFLDPDTSDVPWFDKREALAEYAYLAAASAAVSRVVSLEEEVKRLREALKQCQGALAMLIQPDAIGSSTIPGAWAACVAAEAKARQALSEGEQT